MKIYRMTATFGKLKHQQLSFGPGINVVEAPNEWGKSTWCAFLIAMLYGLDTRARTTKQALADKERYTPWSGELMAGRIDLNWRGRDITIERSTQRRVPLGSFKAYETGSGIPVPELTAENCGAWLLGVEQSVFRRSAFIRLGDLPVTQDEALRARLNALVTTGDESGDAERLAVGLKELKNRCRYNKKGLLPQAERELEDAQEKRREVQELQDGLRELKLRRDAAEQESQALKDHLAAMDHAQALESAQRVALAREELAAAREELSRREADTAELPGREQTLGRQTALRELTEAFRELGPEPEEEAPVMPELPQTYQVEDPQAMVRADQRSHQALGRRPLALWCAAAALGVAGAVLAVLKLWIWALAAVGLGALVLAIGLMIRVRRREKQLLLEEKYGSRDRELWEKPLADHAAALEDCRRQLLEQQERRERYRERLRRLEEEREALCGDVAPERALELCGQILERWTALEEAQKAWRICREHNETVSAVARAVPPAPEREDTLTLSREQTNARLEALREELWSLHSRIGRSEGRLQSLPGLEELDRECGALRDRIAGLEDIYTALTVAQEALAQARQELQRRFAPEIVKRAKGFMEIMTSGRYDKLTMDEELSLQAGTAEEDTIQSVLWRSDGTVDQLYLALRLAVAEALAPEAPLILDDALVRFDDGRLKAALELLEQFAQSRQVIIFTCHSREKKLLEEK